MDLTLKRIANRNSYLLILAVFLASCSGHNQIIDKKIQDLKNNNYSSKVPSDYYKPLEVSENNKDALLFAEEAGRIALIYKDSDRSIQEFNKVLQLYNIKDEQSKLAGAGSKVAASTFANDMAMSYDGADFERIAVSFYQSINYLRNKQMDKALVAIRATSDNQNLAIAKREKDMFADEKEISEYSFSSDMETYLAQAKSIRSEGKSRFLNAYVYYVSGVLRELNGDVGGALVDYKKALEIYPDNKFIIEDALRISAFYDAPYYQNLKNTLQKNKNTVLEVDNNSYKNSKTILVLYEQGFIPAKDSFDGTVYIAGVWARASIPVYKENDPQLNQVSVKVYDGTQPVAVKAEEINNFYKMARNDLAEKYAGIISRQITRLATKSSAQVALQELNDNVNKGNGTLGFIMGAGIGIISIVGTAAEQADKRSFRTLPAYAQVAKLSTKNEVDSLVIEVNGRQIKLEDVKINNGEIAIIYVVDTGNNVYSDVIYQGKKR